MCTCNHHSTTDATAAPAHGTVFKVADMTCSHCAGTIRTALNTALPGAAVAIDVDLQQVTVDGDPVAAEAAIRDAGYDPRPLVH